MLGLFGFVMAYWWLMIITSLVTGGVAAALAGAAPRLVGPEPRNLSALRTSMALTALSIVLAGIGVFVGTAYLFAYLFGMPLVASSVVLSAVAFTVILILFQWLISPYLINALYRTRPPRSDYEKRVEEALREVARRSGIKTPKLRIAETSIPNAFSYGSPLAGSYVAVTRGLLDLMPFDEVRAVLGHEVGHLRHRDVSWILALSVIPLAVYYLGQMLIWSGILGGWGGGEGERGGGQVSGGLILALVGMVLVAVSVLFRFLVGNFNRLREYYADANSAMVTSPRLIQRALARLHLAVNNRYVKAQVNSTAGSMAKALFIVAPFVEIHGGFLYEPGYGAWPWRRRGYNPADYRDIDIDAEVERIKQERTNPVEEIFATHPPIPKRLRFIDNIKYEINPAEP